MSRSTACRRKEPEESTRRVCGDEKGGKKAKDFKKGMVTGENFFYS
jgi:hypothetical protein